MAENKKKYLDYDGLLYLWQKIKGKLNDKLDSSAYVANSKTADGYVAKGEGQVNKVWKTDANGVPAWRDDDNTVYTHPAGNAASKSSGLYKFSTDTASHINSVTAVTKADITALGIPGTDTNTAHSHAAGVGLVGSGQAGTSGTYTYSAALADSTLDTNAAVSRPTANAERTYPVIADKNGQLATIVPWENDDTTYTFTADNPTLAWGTTSTIGTAGETTYKVTMPANPNTDTKVTSAANHYTPTADSASQIGADASSTTSATWNTTSLVTGVNLQRDTKGHVTGVTVDSIRMPANPNTDNNQKISAKSGSSAVTFGNNDTVEIVAGSNVTITPNATNKSITIASADTKVTAVANHYTPSADSASQLSADASSTTAATWGSTSLVTGVNLQRDAKGHVTGVTVDSIKMPANPDTNTHYTTGMYIGATNTKANAVTTNGNTYIKLYDDDTKRSEFKISGSGATSVASDKNGNITISSTNTTYGVATATTNGLMSSGDKNKLDNIAAGATKVVVDAALSSSSTNPVQNKAIVNELNNYAKKSDITGVFSFKGSAAAVPPLTQYSVGSVLNITQEFTTDADFVEGAGKIFPAGTNVVVVDTDTTGTAANKKWDVFTGFFDLSPYQLSADLVAITNAEIDTIIDS